MKIKVAIVVEKIVDAPEFFRPYITREKKWYDMDYEEYNQYENWCDAQGNVLDCDDYEWEIVEDE